MVQTKARVLRPSRSNSLCAMLVMLVYSISCNRCAQSKKAAARQGHTRVCMSPHSQMIRTAVLSDMPKVNGRVASTLTGNVPGGDDSRSAHSPLHSSCCLLGCRKQSLAQSSRTQPNAGWCGCLHTHANIEPLPLTHACCMLQMSDCRRQTFMPCLKFEAP